jgi:hypothetical protein
MKNQIKKIYALAPALCFGAVASFAQSTAATHVSNSATYSVAASGEASAAAADSTVGSVRVVAGVAAVPLWISGSAIGASGAAGRELGTGAAKGGKELWDFSTGETTARPALDRTVGIPPLKVVRPKDPAPAEALGRKQ